ncbi:MAG TPA: hypothetical protein VIM73_17035 [Polyangiaceae bacterium]
MNGFRTSLILGVVSCWLPSVAFAQASPVAPPPEVPRGRIDLTTQAPAPLVPRSYRMHDGFYARASVGFGSLGANFDDDDPSGRDLDGSGFALGGDVMIGGSPARGLALGGALLAQGALSAELDRPGQPPEDRGVTVLILGPFVDGFPIPSKGWHVGGMLGLALSNIEDSSNDGFAETRGFGGAAWFGHDFWVADEWSMGPLLRLAGTLTRDKDADVNASSLSLMLLFTALHH